MSTLALRTNSAEMVWRRFKNRFMLGLVVLAALAAVVPLFALAGFVFYKGFSGLNLDFFTQLPKPVGETGGGMAHAVLGTATIVLAASLIGIPWGLGIGVFLWENKKSRLARSTRFLTEILSSVPSIVVGLFVYALVVMPMKGFSAFAGAVALAIIMVPIVARASEEILKRVPRHIREAGLALGLPKWRVVLQIILPGSKGPLVTAVMLAVARVSGETAPLLFTAFASRTWSQSLFEPTATLPVQIYTYAISPFEDWHRQAWVGSLALLSFVMVINLSMRLAFGRAAEGRKG